MLETFGCSRFVYNHYLTLQKERYAQGQKHLSRTDCNNDCNRVLKNVCYKKILGLDYKSDGLYMDSEGHCAGIPHFYRMNQKKLAKAQRKLKKKTARSKNYARHQKKIAKIHRKSANQRKDYLHKKSTETANQYDLACVESLNMRRLANRGFGNGKATLDNRYGMFLTMLEYKLADRGKCLIKVDPWFPSTKTCCICGRIKEIALSDRRYICICGNDMDRDHNAAVNIRKKGYEMYCREAG